MNVLQEFLKADSARLQVRELNPLVAEEMRRRRKVAKRTMKSVADELGCTIGWICDLEYGRRQWTSEWVNKFQSVLEKVA